MNKFQQLVESQFEENTALNEGIASTIKNKVQNSVSAIKDVAGDLAYQSKRKRYLTGLTPTSSKEQLDAAHLHMTSSYVSSKDAGVAAKTIIKHPKATDSQLADSVLRSAIYNKPTNKPNEHYVLINGTERNAAAKLAIQHPNASTNTLKAAVTHSVGDTSEARTSEGNILRGAEQHPEHSALLQSIANHPKVNSEIINNIAYKASASNDTKTLHALAKNVKSNSNTLSVIANHNSATAATLHAIAAHPALNKDVAIDIAHNPNTDKHTLNLLSDKPNSVSASTLVGHKNASADMIDKIVKSGQGISAAALNPNTSSATLDHIAKLPVSSSAYARTHLTDSLLSHPNTSSSTLRHLYNNHPHLRDAISAHPNGGNLQKFGLPRN